MSKCGYLLIIMLIMCFAGCASFQKQEQYTKLIMVTASPVESEITVAIANKKIKIGATPIEIWVTRPNLEYFEITAIPVKRNYPEKRIAVRKGDPVPAALHFDFSKD